MRNTKATVEALYEAFLAGDAEGMLAVMEEDVEVSFLGQVQLHGKDEARRFFEFAGTLLTDVSFTLEEVVVDGEVAAGIWRETATTSAGEPWQNHGVDLIHVRDGKVVALHENNDVRKVYRHFPRYQPS
jgi:ketosteroid isomerase-like protein